MKKNPEGLRMLNCQKTATLVLPFNPNKLALPNTDHKAAAGAIVFLDKEPAIIVHRVDVPFLGHQDGAIDVFGNSMLPTFPSGCRVGINRLSNYQLLDWGHCYYIIDKNWQGTVRRIYQGETESSLCLVADNPNKDKFPPIQRQWDHIEVIFRVNAGIWKL